MGGWSAYRDLITRYFGMVMALAFAIGLFVPGIEQTPKYTVPCFLAIIIFFSCSQIRMNDFKSFRGRDVSVIIILRFLLLPVLVFWFADIFLNDYKYALLMMTLLPCGAALSAFMGIVGGNSALGLSAMTLTSLIAPFSIPFMFYLLVGISIDVDVWGMFQTLLLMVFVPVILYFGWIRRYKKTASLMRENSSVAACLLISAVIMVVASYQKYMFFQDVFFLIETLIIGFLCYGFFYVAGWLFVLRSSRQDRISYGLLSGMNNLGLGVSLAVMFLPANESIIMVVWEINWIISLVAFQHFAKSKYG